MESDEPGTGSLLIGMIPDLSRIIIPDDSVSLLKHYRLSGVHSDGVAAFDPVVSLSYPIRVDNLAGGDWEITFEGLNSSGQTIAGVSEDVTVIPDETTTYLFPIALPDTLGTLSVHVTWPADVRNFSKVKGTFTSVITSVTETFEWERTSVAGADGISSIDVKELNFAPGVYECAIEFIDSEGESVGPEFNDTLLILQDMASSLDFETTVDMFPSYELLASLVPSTGRLVPSFDVFITSYFIPVPSDTDTLTLTAESGSPAATVSANSGVPQVLESDENTIVITVTAEDGITTCDYEVNVKKMFPVTREQLENKIAAGEDVRYADVSGITDMSYLFYGNDSFNQDISLWDVSHVTDMSHMFHDAGSFNRDLSSWDTSNVTDMSSMFNGYVTMNEWGYLEKVESPSLTGIGNWDVSNVRVMIMMFSNNPKPKDISHWDTSNVETMHSMFFNTQYADYDISHWDTHNVTDMRCMFYNTLIDCDLSDWDVGSVEDHLAFNFFEDSSLSSPSEYLPHFPD